MLLIPGLAFGQFSYQNSKFKLPVINSQICLLNGAFGSQALAQPTFGSLQGSSRARVSKQIGRLPAAMAVTSGNDWTSGRIGEHQFIYGVEGHWPEDQIAMARAKGRDPIFLVDFRERRHLPLNVAEAADEFSKEFEEGGLSYHKILPHQTTRSVAMAIDRLRLNGLRALDVGAGDGSLSVLMAKKGASVTAIDFKQYRCLCMYNAKQNGVQHSIRFISKDAQNLNPAVTGPMDVLVLNLPFSRLQVLLPGLLQKYPSLKFVIIGGDYWHGRLNDSRGNPYEAAYMHGDLESKQLAPRGFQPEARYIAKSTWYFDRWTCMVYSRSVASELENVLGLLNESKYEEYYDALRDRGLLQRIRRGKGRTESQKKTIDAILKGALKVYTCYGDFAYMGGQKNALLIGGSMEAGKSRLVLRLIQNSRGSSPETVWHYGESDCTLVLSYKGQLYVSSGRTAEFSSVSNKLRSTGMRRDEESIYTERGVNGEPIVALLRDVILLHDNDKQSYAVDMAAPACLAKWRQSHWPRRFRLNESNRVAVIDHVAAELTREFISRLPPLSDQSGRLTEGRAAVKKQKILKYDISTRRRRSAA